MSVYERIERMQAKDPLTTYSEGLLVSLKSGCNIPSKGLAPVNPKQMVINSPDDE